MHYNYMGFCDGLMVLVGFSHSLGTNSLSHSRSSDLCCSSLLQFTTWVCVFSDRKLKKPLFFRCCHQKYCVLSWRSTVLLVSFSTKAKTLLPNDFLQPNIKKWKMRIESNDSVFWVWMEIIKFVCFLPLFDFIYSKNY